MPRHLNHQEADIQARLVKTLRSLEWFVKPTHGNMYQSGFPDLYCAHRKYGQRWIEVKLPGMIGSKFTSAQLDTFPQLAAAGVGIWILTSHEECELRKLFGPPNWYMFLGVINRN